MKRASNDDCSEGEDFDRPLVSVIIPLFNAQGTVGETLTSLQRQTYSHLEVIVVNDGSSDGGPDLCERRAREDARIKVIHQDNRGPASARNAGIRYSRGDFVAFIDSDDLWRPDKVARHLRHLHDRPTVGGSFSSSSLIDEQGQPIGLFQTPKLTGITPALVLMRNPFSNGSNVILRREVLEEIRFTDNLYGCEQAFYFDDRFQQSEDIECWMRIALRTDWELEGLAEPLTLYRLSGGGLTAKVDRHQAFWEQVLTGLESYAPEIVATHGRKARAYHLRYLARRCLRSEEFGKAWQLLLRSLREAPMLILEDPIRTGVTVAAAIAGSLLPRRVFGLLQSVAIVLIGRGQAVKLSWQCGQGTW